jgi:hypothetical protein
MDKLLHVSQLVLMQQAFEAISYFGKKHHATKDGSKKFYREKKQSKLAKITPPRNIKDVLPSLHSILIS